MFSVCCPSSLRPPRPLHLPHYLLLSVQLVYISHWRPDGIAICDFSSFHIFTKSTCISRADSLLCINIVKWCCCSFLVLANTQEAFQELGFIISKGGRRERRGRERGKGGIGSQGSLNQPSSTPPQVPRTALVLVSQEGLWAKITINHDHTGTEPSFQHLKARCLQCHHRMVPIDWTTLM